MAKHAKPTVIPKLRFSAFQQSDGWEEKSLKDICAINPPGDGLPDSFIYIDLESVEGGILHTRQHIDRQDAPSRAQRLLRNGDVIFQVVRPYQRNNLFVNFNDNDTYVASTGYAQLRAYDSDRFLYQIVHSDPFTARVIAKCTGSNYPAINSSDLADVLSFVPPTPDEQQKIADCLASLDEVIVAQGRKVEALKAHKRGLMQQLFPRKDETIPRLRFPTFRDGPEWRVLQLNEVLKSKPVYGVNEPAVAYSVKLPTYLRITDIGDDGRFITEGRASVDIEATDDDYLSDGDIVLARTGASVGKSYRYRKEDGRLVFAGFLIRIRANKKKIVPKFLSSFLTTSQYWSWVLVTSARSGQPGINGSEYGTLPIPIPPQRAKDDELAEQQRIADCLSSLDALIGAESDKLNALKTHKTGLMQQLFPSPGVE
jgi:type I restriction enzyme S subunit